MSSAPWRGKPRGTFRSGAQKLQREIALGCASDTLCKLEQAFFVAKCGRMTRSCSDVVSSHVASLLPWYSIIVPLIW